MIIKKVITIIILQLFCISMLLSAYDFNILSEQYRNLLERWINNETSREQALLELSNIETEMSGGSLDREVLYWKSKFSFFRGQIHYELGDKELSVAELKKCLDYAEQANKLREDSEILGIMAEANSLLLLQMDFLYKVANYNVTMNLVNRALELDPANIKAGFVKAQYLCNAPPIAGGDFEEGVSLFKTLVNRPDLEDFDRFYVLQGLAEVYENDGRTNEAANLCRQALMLFPGNRKCNSLCVKSPVLRL